MICFLAIGIEDGNHALRIIVWHIFEITKEHGSIDHCEVIDRFKNGSRVDAHISLEILKILIHQ